MADKVIVTGNPRGQVVVHYGMKIIPGGRYTVDKAMALALPNDIIILEEVKNLETPKPAVREKAADVLRKDDDSDALALVGAEGGRIDKGSQQRKNKG